jgi:hypothetical protein
MSDLSGICVQRKLFQLYNIPPIRYEVISPYTGAVTQEQLNMRRKTEILKYNKNSTQGPRMTQKQKLAVTFRGGFNASRIVCPNDYKIPALTTSAGVPGPPMYLVEDPNIPLYNYTKDTNAYAENLYEDNTQWVFSTNTNQLSENNETLTEVAKLIIRKPIQQPSTQFTYRTPILFRMRGIGLALDCSGATITASIDTSTLSFRATYNNDKLDNNTELTSRFLKNSYIPTPNNSISAILSPPAQQAVVPPALPISTFNYFCEAYVGILEISGIILATSPGFVYGFNIKYILDKTAVAPISNLLAKTTTEQNIREKTVFELYANLADSYILQPSTNCTLQPGSILVSPPAKEIEFNGIPV